MKYDIKPIKDSPIAKAYRDESPQYSYCGCCGYPHHIRGGRSVPMTGTLLVWAVCKVCWEEISLEDLKTCHKNLYDYHASCGNMYYTVDDMYRAVEAAYHESRSRRKIEHTEQSEQYIRESLAAVGERLSALNDAIISDMALQQSLSGQLVEIERKKKKKCPIGISDHAVMRYCERVIGVDLVKVKEAILPEGTLELMEKLGWADGHYPAFDGTNHITVVVKNKSVVTVMVKEAPNPKKKQNKKLRRESRDEYDEI